MERLNNIKNNIAGNIRKYREAAGMTQKELADKMGLVFSSISYWESGRSIPNANQVFELCKLFGVEPTVMFGVEDDYQVKEMDDSELLAAYHSAPDHIRLAVDSLLGRK